MRVVQILTVFVMTAVAACSAPAAENAELDGAARALYAEIAQGRDAEIQSRMASMNPPEQVRAQVSWLRTLVPADAPPTPEVTGRNAYEGEEGERYSVVHQYGYADRSALMHTAFIREGADWKVEYFNVNVTLKPAEQATARAMDAAG